jgi:hypothetical protein
VLFVTVLALHVHIEVELVLSDPQYAGMAAHTVLVMGSYLSRLMRLMAFIAIELHRRLNIKKDLLGLSDRSGIGCKELHVQGVIFLQLFLDAFIAAVAIKTLHPAGLEVLAPVSVTVETGKPAHALAMHLPVGMTFSAEFFRGQEAMETALVGFELAVALRAFELLHIHMLGMEERLIDSHGLALGVALVAFLRAHDDMLFVTLGHHGRTLQYEAYQQLVHFRYREMMAIVTVKLLVLALRP